jgi:hypothetical protein
MAVTVIITPSVSTFTPASGAQSNHRSWESSNVGCAARPGMTSFTGAPGTGRSRTPGVGAVLKAASRTWMRVGPRLGAADHIRHRMGVDDHPSPGARVGTDVVVGVRQASAPQDLGHGCPPGRPWSSLTL